MEKKSKKGLYAIIGVLMVLLVLLIILAGIILVEGKKEKKKDGRNAGPFVADDGRKQADMGKKDEGKDVFQKEVKEEEKETSDGIRIVVDGFKLQVPPDYGCFYAEEIGPVIYMDDVLQMKIVVRDIPYEKSMENPDSLTEKTVAAGGEVLQDVKEIKINGRKYAYFRMRIDGEECFAAYTQAAQEDKQLAAQIVIESESLTDDDLLHVFADIAASAEVTDEPDSTGDDIEEQETATGKGEKKEKSTLHFHGQSVTFGVPEGFYSQGMYTGSSYSTENFMSADHAVMVDCYCRDSSTEDIYKSAKDYIEIEWDNLIGSVKDEATIRTMDVEGVTYYYILVHYEFDGSDYQYIYAACDVGESGIYSVKASVVDEDVRLSVKTVRDFLVLVQ